MGMFCDNGGSTQSAAEQRTPRELQRAATGLQQRPNREGSVLSRAADTLAMDLGLTGRTTGYLAGLAGRQAASASMLADTGDSDSGGAMAESAPARAGQGFIARGRRGSGYYSVTYRPESRTAEAGKGYDPTEIGTFMSVRERAREAIGAPSSREKTSEEFLAEEARRGKIILQKYVGMQEAEKMSQRQHLAALEIFQQQDGKDRFLSAEDLAFIRAGAGGEGDIVYSPTEVVLPRSGDRTEAARFVRQTGTDPRVLALRAARAARPAKPEPPKPVSEIKGRTIFTSPQGLGEPATGQVGRRRSLIGAR